jgi:hypothetical protein
MKKIGIVTFVKCSNYGAELQAYALQKKLNLLGYDAEVIDMEKEKGVLEGSFATYKNAIINRYREYGIIKGTAKIVELIYDKYQVRKTNTKFAVEKRQKDEIFNSFFANYIRHSSQYYTLKELRNIHSMPYDVLIAGSDQIWNFMQTRYLDVFFLMMGNHWEAKKISYAASFGVKEIPKDLTCKYREYLENMDAISVREINGLDIVNDCSSRQAKLVLDPTLLLTRDEWVSYIGRKEYLPSGKKYVVIYTLSGSHYIYTLAKKIAKVLNVEIINIKNGYERKNGDEGIIHITEAGPQEFISIYNQAAYVITDSFHGTAFSINFNIPFTTLLNPVSNINSRALSILKLTGTESRLIYDDGSNKEPDSLKMDFIPVNEIITYLRKDSLDYLKMNI